MPATQPRSHLHHHELPDLHPRNQYDLQEFESFIQLENKIYLTIPSSLDSFPIDKKERQQSLKKNFKQGNKIPKDLKPLLTGSKIVNIHFPYFRDEIDDEEKAFIELENGYFISEYNFGPLGVNNVDLKIITKQDFQELTDEETTFKSLK